MKFGDIYNLPIPRCLCPHCAAIWTSNNVRIITRHDKTQVILCPICETSSEQGQTKPIYTDDDEFLRHATALAAPSQRAARSTESPNYFRTLPFLLARAEHFVTFLSSGIGTWFLGTFAVAAQRPNVMVKGVVTNIDMTIDWVQTSIIDPAHALNMPDLDIKFVSKEEFRDKDQLIGSHGKMVCIDGVFMMHGSTNLTTTGYQNANQSRDIMNITTNTEFIVDFHNKYFASAWMHLADKERAKRDVDDYPF